MALIQATVAQTIRAAMLSNPASKATDNEALTAFCEGLASALVAVLTTQTTLVPVLLSPPGVAGGPVTGTVVIT